MLMMGRDLQALREANKELRDHLVETDKVARDKEEALRQLTDRVKELETAARRRAERRDFILVKLLPTMAALIIAYGTVATVAHLPI